MPLSDAQGRTRDNCLMNNTKLINITYDSNSKVEKRSSRLLKNPPFAAAWVGWIGFLGLVVERIEVCGPLVAALGVWCAAGGHQIAASAMSLGNRTRL